MTYIPVTKPTATSPGYTHLAKRSYVTEMRQIQGIIQHRACAPIQFAQPILTLDGIGIIYPNSITTVQGQKGVHKSRLTENFCAGFLRMDPNIDFIGFRVTPMTRFHVVYIDTERNQKDQFPHAVQRIKQQAGLPLTSHPSNLEAVSLISIDRSERFEAIAQYLEDVRLKHPDELIIVVLDVTTDCVENFNDPKGSLEFLDHLNSVINQYNVAFICVIHENPTSFGDGKARGHLGTELINKSTTVISIGYERGAGNVATDLIAVKFLHTRSTKRPEPHYLRYSEEAQGLVVANAQFIQEEKNKKVEKADLPELKDWLTENLTASTSKTDLVTQLMSYFDCSDKTVATRLKRLTAEPNAFLLASTQGREVFYQLSHPLIYTLETRKAL